jgi:hypothetical protein
MDHAAADAAFRHMDADRSGAVSFDELCAWYSVYLAGAAVRMKKRKRRAREASAGGAKAHDAGSVHATRADRRRARGASVPHRGAHYAKTREDAAQAKADMIARALEAPEHRRLAERDLPAMDRGRLEEACKLHGLPSVGDAEALRRRLAAFLFRKTEAAHAKLTDYEAATRIQAIHRGRIARRAILDRLRSVVEEEKKVSLSRELYDPACGRHYTLMPSVERVEAAVYLSYTRDVPNTRRYRCQRCQVRFAGIRELRRHECAGEEPRRQRRFPSHFSPQQLEGGRRAREWGGWVTTRPASIPFLDDSVAGWPTQAEADDKVEREERRRRKGKRPNAPPPEGCPYAPAPGHSKARVQGGRLNRTARRGGGKKFPPPHECAWWVYRFGELENRLVEAFRHAELRANKKVKAALRGEELLGDAWRSIDLQGDARIGPIDVAMPGMIKILRLQQFGDLLFDAGRDVMKVAGPDVPARRAYVATLHDRLARRRELVSENDGFVHSCDVRVLLRNIFLYSSCEQLFRALWGSGWRSGKHGRRSSGKGRNRRRGAAAKSKKKTTKKEPKKPTEEDLAASKIQSIQRGRIARRRAGAKAKAAKRTPKKTKRRRTNAMHLRLTLEDFKQARVMMGIDLVTSQGRSQLQEDAMALKHFSTFACEPGRERPRKKRALSAAVLEKIAETATASFDGFVGWVSKTRVW